MEDPNKNNINKTELSSTKAADQVYLDKIKEFKEAGVLYGMFILSFVFALLNYLSFCLTSLQSSLFLCICTDLDVMAGRICVPRFTGLPTKEIAQIPYVQMWMNDRNSVALAAASKEVPASLFLVFLL
jgi:hypothetical protein